MEIGVGSCVTGSPIKVRGDRQFLENCYSDSVKVRGDFGTVFPKKKCVEIDCVGNVVIGSPIKVR